MLSTAAALIYPIPSPDPESLQDCWNVLGRNCQRGRNWIIILKNICQEFMLVVCISGRPKKMRTRESIWPTISHPEAIFVSSRLDCMGRTGGIVAAKHQSTIMLKEGEQGDTELCFQEYPFPHWLCLVVSVLLALWRHCGWWQNQTISIEKSIPLAALKPAVCAWIFVMPEFPELGKAWGKAKTEAESRVYEGGASCKLYPTPE